MDVVIRRFLFAAAVAAAAPAHALDFRITNPNQADFNTVARDLTAALDYKPIEPVAAGGIAGFSIGAFGSYAPVSDSGAWKRLTGEDIDGVGLVGLSATKGLPLGFDIGAFYAGVPGTDARAYGGQLRYAILRGSAVTPAIAVRGTYTKASSLEDFDYDSYGADIAISKGFLLFTPYAGLGLVHSEVSADPKYRLDDAGSTQAKGFAGVRMSFGLFEATAEYERLGSSNVYNGRLGFSF
jgi:hypothetical protein